jgi:hypothetical protein
LFGLSLPAFKTFISESMAKPRYFWHPDYTDTETNREIWHWKARSGCHFASATFRVFQGWHIKQHKTRLEAQAAIFRMRRSANPRKRPTQWMVLEASSGWSQAARPGEWVNKGWPKSSVESFVKACQS